MLAAPAVLLSLAVLLLNDFVLKAAFPGTVTGKLSDLAGLFVFPLFWTALLPRHRTVIHWLTAAGFIWWKLPLSQGFIDAWNARVPVPIGRTVDATDLIALLAVVAAWRFSEVVRPRPALPFVRQAVVPVALFAFAATTRLTTHQYERAYAFRVTPLELRERLDALGIRHAVPAGPAREETLADGVGRLNATIPNDWGGTIVAHMYVLDDSVGSTVLLRGMQLIGPYGGRDQLHMLDFFERCLVQRLDSLLTDGAAVRRLSVQQPLPPRHDLYRCG